LSISLLNKALTVFFVAILGVSCTDPRIKQIEQFESQYFDARKRGDIAEAIAVTRSIQKLDPNEVAHLDTLALLYLEMGAFSAAKDVADSAIQLIPIISTVKVAIACAKNLSHYVWGEQYTQLLLKLGEPESADLLFELAWFQYHARHYKECIITLEKIVTNSNYQRLNKSERVVRNGQTRIEQMPLVAVSHNLIGACQYELGDLESARSSFANAITWYPNYLEARDNLLSLEGS
jgi:tetratricopeptide (TPR) repeat protein